MRPSLVLESPTADRRTPSSRPVLLGTAIAALAVGLVIGSGVLRPSDGQAPAPDGVGAPTAALPHASASETQPAAAVGDAGPTRTVSGVGVGFSRERAGAAAAATSYQLALGDVVLALDEPRREAALSAIASTAAHPRLTDEFSAAVAAVRDGGLDAASVRLQRQVPLGYRIDSYGGNDATVAVWTLQVLALGPAPVPEARWSTTLVELVWERDDWRLVGFRTEDGPAPTLQGDGETIRTIEAIEALQEYAHAPE